MMGEAEVVMVTSNQMWLIKVGGVGCKFDWLQGYYFRNLRLEILVKTRGRGGLQD